MNTTLYSATYSSSLTRQSQVICLNSRCGAYVFYQAVLVNITVTGSYRLYSQSNLDTIGYLYNQSFDTRYLGVNLIASNDDGYGNSQFLITAQLPAGGRYIAIVTTYLMNATGAYSLVVTGPGPIVLTPINTTGKIIQHQIFIHIHISSFPSVPRYGVHAANKCFNSYNE